MELALAYDQAVAELAELRQQRRVLESKVEAETALRPYQIELLKLQAYLEASRQRMIVLFEGRDAAGKGGAIRRVTRYMNAKYYRVVALGEASAVLKGHGCPVSSAADGAVGDRRGDDTQDRPGNGATVRERCERCLTRSRGTATRTVTWTPPANPRRGSAWWPSPEYFW